VTRHTRYQAIIIQDHHVLLIQHKEHATGHAYWVIPGGGIEEGETEQQCVLREAKEETHLDVQIERLLFDEPAHPDGPYQWRKTYLCKPIGGVAAPGYEPEEEASAMYVIDQIMWLDLRTDREWGQDILRDPFTYPQLVKIREVLGY
jgi:ADP-ribose pyrophosphatase YjhB (NUDIX family)